ncbi:MAG: ATP-binding protein [Tepidisphaeraceae bacterium]
MSRIVSGKLRLDVHDVSIDVPVRAAVEVVHHAAEAKGIKLDVTINEPEPLTVRGDANRLQQVVWNLLSNAVKFTPAAGRVGVQVRRDASGSGVRIEVADNGAGISADFLPFVFDRFRQADSSMSRRHGGLGLGLSIVKQLVELHGGEVEARSEGLGHGSTFMVRLPLSRADSARQASCESDEGTHQADLEGIRVLVVDDERDARELIRSVLEGHRAAVQTAGSVRESILILDRDRPDVVLTDLGMPDEDGYELLRQVRDRDHLQNVPVVALTAFARAEDRTAAITAGFDDHLPKPIDSDRLIQTLMRLSSGAGLRD